VSTGRYVCQRRPFGGEANVTVQRRPFSNGVREKKQVRPAAQGQDGALLRVLVGAADNDGDGTRWHGVGLKALFLLRTIRNEPLYVSTFVRREKTNLKEKP